MWRVYTKSGCCAEKRRFRKDQVTRRDSVARRAMFGNWRLAAEKGADGVVCDYRRGLSKDVSR
jgi:hypothetical protein